MIFNFIQMGQAIQILYQYVKEELIESDFIELSVQECEQLSESDPKQRCYTINSAKLNKKYAEEPSSFIVDVSTNSIIVGFG